MRPKQLIPRRRANEDVERAIAYYLREAGQDAALGFIDALERAYRHIARYPTSGSPRYAHELNLPGLRFRPLERHPYLVFFVERDDPIDVWCVLHGARDIPEWMREPES